MTSLKLYLSTGIDPLSRGGIKDSIGRKFAELPNAIRHDAVMAIIECEVDHGIDADQYWLEVMCSEEDPEGVVLLIANHFTDVVDVKAYHPQTGTFKFKLRGTAPLVGF